MAIVPPIWSWPPVNWPAGGDAPDEIQMPADNFADVAPADLLAARDERDNPGEMQFPPDSFADVAPADLAAARAELAAPAEIEMPADYVGTLPPEAPEHSYYIGYPRIPDEPPAPEAPPAADAITGAGGVPIAPLVSGLGIPQATFEQAMRLVPTETKGTPELPDEYLSNQEMGQAFAALSPEEQLNRQLDLEQRRSDMQRQRIAEASKADAERAEREEQNWRTSREDAKREMAQIDAEAKAEAAREIDINRGWADASTGTKIAGIFSALAGGLVAHKYGGRNSGLEMIDKLIDRDIDAQKFNKLQRTNDLTRRGASARERLAMAGDDFREETRLRLTAYDRVLGQIASDAQNFDPRGTQAIRYGQAYQDLAAKRSQLAVDAQKRAADAYKEQLDFAGKELDLQKKQAELAKAQRAAMGGGGGGARAPRAEDMVMQPFEFSALGLVPPPVAMSRRQHGEWLKDKKSSNDVIANTTQGKSTEEMTRGIGGIKNPDGSPFLAYGETGAVTELRNQVVAARSVARLMDEVTRLRSGWTSDSAKSEEWQRIKANWAQVKGLAKNLLKLGALSESDYELVDGFIGSPDPTGYRDPTAGILKARENLIQSTQDALAGAGYEGRFDIPRPKLAPPTESASDREFKDALRTPNAGEIMKAAQSGAGIVAPGREYDSDDVVLPTVRSTIDRLTQVAKSGPKAERDAARAQLEKLLTDGGTRGVRSAAEAALIEVGRPTESDGPRQATVKDSISEPVR